jgi:hypothetical protein
LIQYDLKEEKLLVGYDIELYVKSDQYPEFQPRAGVGPIDSVYGVRNNVSGGEDKIIILRINKDLGTNIIFKIYATANYRKIYTPPPPPRGKPKRLTFGVGIGGTISNLIGKGDEGFQLDPGMKLLDIRSRSSGGVEVNLSVSYPLSDRMAIELEPIISYTNYRYAYSIKVDSTELRRFTMDYSLFFYQMALKLRMALVTGREGAQLVLSPGIMSQNLSSADAVFKYNVNDKDILNDVKLEGMKSVVGNHFFGLGTTISWARNHKVYKTSNFMHAEWYFSTYYWLKSAPVAGGKLVYDQNLFRNNLPLPGFSKVNFISSAIGLRFIF